MVQRKDNKRESKHEASEETVQARKGLEKAVGPEKHTSTKKDARHTGDQRGNGRMRMFLPAWNGESECT